MRDRPRTRAGRLCSGLVPALLVCALPSMALAATPRIPEPTHLGMGLGIGSLAYGISAKYYLDASGSIQGNMGIQPTQSRSRNGDIFALGADYLFEFGAFASANNIDLALGVGPGLSAAFSTLGYAAFDVNACFSAQILFHELPMDFAFEYRPALRLKSSALYDEPGRVVYSLANFGVQLRYYFSMD